MPNLNPDSQADCNLADQNQAELRSAQKEQLAPFELSELQLLESGNHSGRAVNEMALRIEMGRTVMRPSQLKSLRAGAVVALDALADEPVTIYADERPIALGEVMVLEDEYCIRVTELLADSSTPTCEQR